MIEHMTDRRLFRQLVESPDILVLPGVFNGYSVRLVERFGFKAAAITGAGISESVLGWADRGILTFDENLRACRALADCCNIPLLGRRRHRLRQCAQRPFRHPRLRAGRARGDLDRGSGLAEALRPPAAARRSSRRRRWPTRSRPPCDARRDADFMIRARTDAAATDGIPEVIDRLNLYGEAGADIVFADALLSVDDIATVAKNVNKPLAVNMGFGLIERGTTPLVTPRQLAGARRRHRLLRPHAHQRGAARHDECARGLRADDHARTRRRSAPISWCRSASSTT